MRGPIRAATPVLLWLLSGAVSPSLAAAEGASALPCRFVEENGIHIDGLTSDWDGINHTLLQVMPQAGAPARTLSARVFCGYDAHSLYLLVDVDDDVLMRGSGAKEEDHIELAFGVEEKGGSRVDKLFIYPRSSSAAGKQPRVVRWEGKKTPSVVEGEGPVGKRKSKGNAFDVFDALQPRGYAVELRMPRSLIPGYRQGGPLRMAVRVVDSDAPSGGLAATAQTSPLSPLESLSVVELEDASTSMGDLLSDLKLTAGDVYFDKTADIGDGTGRVLMIGKFVAFIGKNYAYQEIVQQRSDIKDVRLIELDGKQQAIALRISERGGSGGRELLRIYRLSGGRFQTLFSAEVAKDQGPRKLSTQVSFGKKGGAAMIELLPQPAVGFSEATYNEMPAQDVIPILLPWQDKKTRYVFKAGAFTKE